MSMTSGAVPSDFFVFFDFEAGLGELVAFESTHSLLKCESRCFN